MTLIGACDAYGPGTLVHPTLGTMQVNCDTWAVSETRERGGMATFEMVFVEAGALTEGGATVNTSAMAIVEGECSRAGGSSRASIPRPRARSPHDALRDRRDHGNDPRR